VIAAADVYHALLEPRPHRAALPRDGAQQVLAAEVTAGRLTATQSGRCWTPPGIACAVRSATRAD